MAELRAVVLAQRAADDVAKLRAELRPAMTRTLIRLGPRLESVYSAVAPKRSGKLASEIRSEFVGSDKIEIVSPVRSAEGYPYTGVTRFGHKTAWIYPRRARALAFSIGGQMRFFARVRGYHPARDWADSGYPLARGEVLAAARDLARSL